MNRKDGPPADREESMGIRVVICGGGVIGAAVAHALARRGQASTIVESDGVASGASGAAAGLLTPPPPVPDALTEIRRLGFALHAELAGSLPAESGIEYGYGVMPRLLVAGDAAEAAGLQDTGAALTAQGREAAWLTAGEVAAMTGWVDRAVHGALRVEPSARVDPYRFTLALLTAAERLGCELRSGRVRGIESRDGRVQAVHVGDQRLEADVVVIAMGPWSVEAAGWLGIPVPVEPLKGQIVKVRPAAPVSTVTFGRAGDYAMAKEPRLVYLGTTEERVGFDRAPTPAARDAILAAAVRFSSSLDDAELVEQTACLRPLSADGLPIIGPVPGLAGAFLATGHGRQGILHAPPTGRAVADLVLDGETDLLDLRAFDPARFGAGVG